MYLIFKVLPSALADLMKTGDCTLRYGKVVWTRTHTQKTANTPAGASATIKYLIIFILILSIIEKNLRKERREDQFFRFALAKTFQFFRVLLGARCRCGFVALPDRQLMATQNMRNEESQLIMLNSMLG